jgi:hypothetical protein
MPEDSRLRLPASLISLLLTRRVMSHISVYSLSGSGIGKRYQINCVNIITVLFHSIRQGGVTCDTLNQFVTSSSPKFSVTGTKNSSDSPMLSKWYNDLKKLVLTVFTSIWAPILDMTTCAFFYTLILIKFCSKFVFRQRNTIVLAQETVFSRFPTQRISFDHFTQFF